MKHKIDSIIKHKEHLDEYAKTKKNIDISQFLSKYKHGNDFNEKVGRPQKFRFHLSRRLDLRGSHKHVALQNLSVYNTSKNARQK